MRIFHYLEIENFKAFSGRQRIELDHPTVLIGPNNSGKTTAIQALALWSQAIKVWQEHREGTDASVRPGVALNRLAVVSVPVERARFYWHHAKPGSTNRPTFFVIAVGLFWRGEVCPLRLQFRFSNDELVYVQPDKAAGPVDPDLVAYAAGVSVNLLYSMSGLQVSETVLVPTYIDSLIGQGRTAEVLRNLCLMVHRSSPDDWGRITRYVQRLFGFTLGVPSQNSQGIIDLVYEQQGARAPLSLAMAGRGSLQVLLILSYLFSHKRSVLLIDEPDAHLEILRQRQIYALLRDIAIEAESQVIIVTHSEAVLEAALDRNLTLLVDGKAEALAKREDIKNALKHFGTGHYVKAREVGHVLYVEGSTDIDMLRALATLLDHPLARSWNERANVYYVENNFPQLPPAVGSEDATLEHVEGGFGIAPKKHFFGIRSMVPALRGLAILDNDGRGRQDSNDGGLQIAYWQRYEAENYFVTPELLVKFTQIAPQGAQTELFAPRREAVEQVIDELVIDRVFRNPRDYETYRQASPDVRRLLWVRSTDRVKLSDLAEEFFRRLAERTRTPMLLRKGELHRLIALVEPSDLDPEVRDKLDLLHALWDRHTAPPSAEPPAMDETPQAVEADAATGEADGDV